MKRLLAFFVLLAVLTMCCGASVVSAKTAFAPSDTARSVAQTTYTLRFTDIKNGTGTLSVYIPAGIANGKIAIKPSADLSYNKDEAVAVAGVEVNDTAIDQKGIIAAFAFARAVSKETSIIGISFNIAQGAVIDESDFDVTLWKLGDGVEYLGTNADGDVVKIIESDTPSVENDNLLLHKEYTVTSDASAMADDSVKATDGKFRGDGESAWNGDLKGDASVEWLGTGKTITYTFTFDKATNVDEIVFKSVRIASNRALGTVIVNDTTVISADALTKTAVEGAPLYSDAQVDQFFDVSAAVNLVGVTELKIQIITDMYCCQYDEIEAYGDNADESSSVESSEPSADSSDTESSEPPADSSDVESSEPSADSSDVESSEPSADSSDTESSEPSADSSDVESSEPSADSSDVESSEPSADSSDVESSEPSADSSDVESSESSADSSDDESTEDPSDILYGDVNDDGDINSLDAAQVLRYDAQLVALDAVALVRADVNGDGTVNSLDAAQILRFDALLIESFPVEENV